MKLFRYTKKKSNTKITFLVALLLFTLFSCQEIIEEPDSERVEMPSNIIKNMNFTLNQQGEEAILLYSEEAKLWEDKDEIELVGVSFQDVTSEQGAFGSASRGSYNEKNSYFTLQDNVEVDHPSKDLTYRGDSLLWNGKKSKVSSIDDDTVTVTIGEDTQVKGKEFSADTRGGSMTFLNGADGFMTIGDQRYNFTALSMDQKQLAGEMTTTLSKQVEIESEVFAMTSDSIVISGTPAIVYSNAPTVITNNDRSAVVNALKATYNSETNIFIGEGWSSVYVQQKDLFLEGSYLHLDTEKNVLTFQVGSHLNYPKEGIDAYADSIMLNLDKNWVEFEGNTRIVNRGNTHFAEVAFLNLSTMEFTLWSTSGSLPVEENEDANETPNE